MSLSTYDRSLDERDLPGYYCPECTAIRFAGEPLCSGCDATRPDGGWRPLSESKDSYLGCVVDERYLITKREAEGGSAIVYRAESLEDGRPVAVKVARVVEPGGEIEERIRERMAREVRAVQMLDNPHIVPIYEFIELNDGPAAIVMEYVAGETAEKHVETHGPMSVSRAAEISRQVAEGLAIAHEVGLVHRDIKPANIMVSSGTHGKDSAFILDFGIVRIRASSGLTDGFVGTPLYASPEQVQMEELDARSDVYSLGASLFYMLTGRPPFDYEETMDVMRAQIEASAPRASERCPTGEVPAELDDLVDRMLRKDPAKRPADLRAVIPSLKRLAESTKDEEVEIRGNQKEDPAGTIPGLQMSRLTDFDAEREDAAEQRAAGNVAHRRPSASPGQRAASSSEFTPVAQGTSEYEPIGDSRESVGFDDEDAAEQTLRGVQALGDRGQSRQLSAENSVAFWPEDDESEAATTAQSASTLSPSPDPGRVMSVVTRDGERFAFNDTTHRLWYTESADASAALLSEHDSAIIDLAIGEAYIWVALSDGNLEQISCAEGNRELCYSTPRRTSASAVAASPDGSLVVAGMRTGDVIVGSVEGSWTTPLSFDQVRSVAAAADGGRFVVGRKNGVVEIYDAANHEKLTEIEYDGDVDKTAMSPEGQLVAVVGRGGAVSVHLAQSGRQIAEFEPETFSPKSLFFSDGSDLRGVSTDEESVTVFDCARDEVVVRILQRETVGAY